MLKNSYNIDINLINIEYKVDIKCMNYKNSYIICITIIILT